MISHVCAICACFPVRPLIVTYIFLDNVTYMSVEVISGMLAPEKCNITFSTSCQENVRLHFPGTNLWKMMENVSYNKKVPPHHGGGDIGALPLVVVKRCLSYPKP